MVEQGPLQRGPQTKQLTNEGQEDIDVFLVRFEMRDICIVRNGENRPAL